MATYVLIPGAASGPWYWHLVAPRLEGRGHDVVAVDLPTGDDRAGLRDYTDAAVAALAGRRRDVVVVGQSMGALTAALLCERVPVGLLVLVAPMLPAPGERPGDWWGRTGHDAARVEAARDQGWDAADDDPHTVFLHDVPSDVVEASAAHVRDQSATPFADPWPLTAWPDVATRVLACRDDRFFPLAFVRRTAREQLGLEPDVMEGGHLPALARPADLAARLDAYWPPR